MKKVLANVKMILHFGLWWPIVSTIACWCTHMFKKIDLCGCITINQCILKTELYNGLKDLIIKGDTTSTSTLRESDCRYSKLIIVTFFFLGFIFFV